jgi:hypothetical protein
MLKVIRRARRRLLTNELVSQAVNAFSAALVAFILLLLTGTELLRWEWLLLLPAAAVAIGLLLAFRRLPAPYVTAQIVDRRLALADTLSTAWYFSQTARPQEPAGILRAQQEQADRMAGTLDLRRAVPFRAPRTIYAFAVLALIASSLFALRYGITRRLELRTPLARMLEQQFHFGEKTVLAKNIRRDPPPPGRNEDPNEELAGQDPNQSAESEPSAEPDSENKGDRTGEKKGSASRADNQKNGDPSERKDAEDQDNQADQRENPSDPRNGDQSSSGKDQQGNRKGDQARQPNSQRDANGSADNSSLMSKVKDAFQNLLSRMKPQQGDSASQQSTEQNSRQQQGKGQPGGKQQSAKDAQRGDSGQKGDAEDGQTNERADNSADPQSKSSGKSDGQQTSKQPGSGVGSQDGDKNIKQAEQLAAMGKISEIIGKRAANLTGEATVEVQSTSQQLRTPYAQRGAEHAQGGTEIDRDEIPVALQSYVEKYFEQVRKQVPDKK